MGCSVGTANQLRDARLEVEQLKKQLEVADSAREDLQQRLKAADAAKASAEKVAEAAEAKQKLAEEATAQALAAAQAAEAAAEQAAKTGANGDTEEAANGAARGGATCATSSLPQASLELVTRKESTGKESRSRGATPPPMGRSGSQVPEDPAVLDDAGLDDAPSRRGSETVAKGEPSKPELGSQELNAQNGNHRSSQEEDLEAHQDVKIEKSSLSTEGAPFNKEVDVQHQLSGPPILLSADLEAEEEAKNREEVQKEVNLAEILKDHPDSEVLPPGLVREGIVMEGMVPMIPLPGSVACESELPEFVMSSDLPELPMGSQVSDGGASSQSMCAESFDGPRASELLCPQTAGLVTVPEEKVSKVTGIAPSTGNLASKGHDMDASLSVNDTTMDSTASTLTPVAAAVQPAPVCRQCTCEVTELFVDPTDNFQYCEQCWIDFYGSRPSRQDISHLVEVEVAEHWHEDLLATTWSDRPIPGWPPPMAAHSRRNTRESREVWTTVGLRLRRGIVGSYARERTTTVEPDRGEILAQRYEIKQVVGEGHFTKAFWALDQQTGTRVCVKRHRGLTMEALSDIMVLSRRMEEVDQDGVFFPKFIDAFWDQVGFTVESLIEGRNCMAVANEDPTFFKKPEHLRIVAVGALQGLALLEQAGVVHNDIKPDNLLWVEAFPPREVSHESAVLGSSSSNSFGAPQVRIVDFGCARLDHREEPGWNWALAEGGAGHLGKWSPEMVLRLPITHCTDVWGLGVSLCELHTGRYVWRNEADTAEVVLAQAIGLCNLRSGLPQSLLRRSPLDIRQLYTPAPLHLPLRRNAAGRLEALKPKRWGLVQILGERWQQSKKAPLGEMLLAILAIDPAERPSAIELVTTMMYLQAQTVERLSAGSERESSMPGSILPSVQQPVLSGLSAEDLLPSNSSQPQPDAIGFFESLASVEEGDQSQHESPHLTVEEDAAFEDAVFEPHDAKERQEGEGPIVQVPLPPEGEGGALPV